MCDELWLQSTNNQNINGYIGMEFGDETNWWIGIIYGEIFPTTIYFRPYVRTCWGSDLCCTFVHLCCYTIIICCYLWNYNILDSHTYHDLSDNSTSLSIQPWSDQPLVRSQGFSRSVFRYGQFYDGEWYLKYFPRKSHTK